jgi:hypothetical protein
LKLSCALRKRSVPQRFGSQRGSVQLQKNGMGR